MCWESLQFSVSCVTKDSECGVCFLYVFLFLELWVYIVGGIYVCLYAYDKYEYCVYRRIHKLLSVCMFGHMVNDVLFFDEHV